MNTIDTNGTNGIPNFKPCGCCKGSKEYDFHWNGTAHVRGPCKYCNATGEWGKPNWQLLIELVTKPNKATGKRSFRKSKPDLNEWHDREHARAYFVWRMIRFHGGADVTMPVMATSAVHYDPYFNELDTFAGLLAKKFFGTELAAAYRWGNALGGSLPVPENMPATAFSCGPVADEHKPEEEMPELIG